MDILYGIKILRDNERKIMNFLVNKILDDGSVSYGLTGSGYVVLIIVCVLLMTIGCFARDNNSKLNENILHLQQWLWLLRLRLP